MDIRTFRKLFVMRKDAYAKQDDNSRSYKTVREELTDDLIKQHLNGDTTIGLYQVNGGMLKWACIDIDIKKEIWSKEGFDLSEWEDIILLQAVEWKKILQNNNIPSYLENSGNKGAHVWMFFENPIYAESIKSALDMLATKVTKVNDGLDWEIYPKQPNADFGNLLKGPDGKHQASQKFSYFIDKVNLSNIKYTPVDAINSLSSPYEAIFKNCEALETMVLKGLDDRHLNHEERLQLAYIFGNLGDGGKEYIKDKVFKHLSDWNVAVTNKNLNRIEGKYKPASCEGLQKRGICKEQCSKIGEYRSPIGFYYREVAAPKEGNKEYHAIESFNPLDRLFSDQYGYYENVKGSTEEPMPPMKIANFNIIFTEDIVRFDDIETIRKYQGYIQIENNNDGTKGPKFPCEILAEHWGDTNQVKKMINRSAGVGYAVTDALPKVIKCVDKQPPPKLLKYSKIMGYHTIEGVKKYFTPTVVVSKDGIEKNTEMPIDFTDENAVTLRGLDFSLISQERFNQLTQHIRKDFLSLTDENIGILSLAVALMPIIYPFLPVSNRFYYLLQGASGAGKTFMLQALQRMYSRFSEEADQDASFLSWSHTPYSLQRSSYYFKDAMCFIDDFKRSNLGKDYEKATTILQNYADNAGRGRLRSDSTSQLTYYSRGWLVLSGEDKVENHASTVARGIMITYPSGKPQNLVAGKAVRENWTDYSGVTPYIIQKVLRSVDADKKYYGTLYETLRQKYSAIHIGKENSDRLSQNFAMVATCVKLLVFPWIYKESSEDIDVKFDVFERWLLRALDRNIRLVSEESSAYLFWTTLKDMLASKKLKIQENNRDVPGDSDFGGGTPIGFKTDNGKTIAVVWGAAFNEVTRHLRSTGSNFAHSRPTVLAELYHKGMIMDEKTVPRTMNKAPVRVVRIPVDKLQNEN